MCPVQACFVNPVPTLPFVFTAPHLTAGHPSQATYAVYDLLLHHHPLESNVITKIPRVIIHFLMKNWIAETPFDYKKLVSFECFTTSMCTYEAVWQYFNHYTTWKSIEKLSLCTWQKWQPFGATHEDVKAELLESCRYFQHGQERASFPKEKHIDNKETGCFYCQCPNDFLKLAF